MNAAAATAPPGAVRRSTSRRWLRALVWTMLAALLTMVLLGALIASLVPHVGQPVTLHVDGQGIDLGELTALHALLAAAAVLLALLVAATVVPLAIFVATLALVVALGLVLGSVFGVAALLLAPLALPLLALWWLARWLLS